MKLYFTPVYKGKLPLCPPPRARLAQPLFTEARFQGLPAVTQFRAEYEQLLREDVVVAERRAEALQRDYEAAVTAVQQALGARASPAPEGTPSPWLGEGAPPGQPLTCFISSPALRCFLGSVTRNCVVPVCAFARTDNNF